MKRLTPVLAVLALALLAGCAKKAEQASTTSSDSLLATNPVEQPQGNIAPSTEYQGQQNPPAQSATPETHATAPKTTHRGEHKSSRSSSTSSSAPASNPGVTVPAGTAHPGDAWTGVVKDPVVIGTTAPIPSGATVNGVIEAVKPAERGDRALLLLAIQSVTVNGRTHNFSATSDSMVAGSTRARNVGAVAGGAAAGALIGHAIGGGKGALIGGLLGAGAATGGVAKSKGYQVTVDEGSAVVFHVTREVAIRD